MKPNFAPQFGSGQAISASTTSASVNGVDTFCEDLYVVNDGSVTAFLRWGVGAQTATTADFPLPGGSAQVVRKKNANTVAAITASGTTTIRIIPGSGQ